MNKKLSTYKTLFLLLAVVCAGVGVTLFQTQDTQTSVHRIAAVLPCEGFAMDELLGGFEKTLREENVPYHLSIIHQQDKVVLAGQVDEAIRQGYTLFMTVGRSTSQSVVNTVKKRSKKIQVVYTAVSEPDKYGVSGSYNDGSVINSTGVEVSMAGAQEMLKPLFELRPDLKKVCILHSSYKMLEEQAHDFSHACRERGILCDTLIIDKVTEVAERLKTYLSSNEIDLIVTFSDPVLNACGPVMKLAKLYNVEVFASEEASVLRGAAYANCIPYSEYGSQAARLSANILLNNIPAHEIPAHVIRDSTDSTLFINPVGLKKPVPREALQKYYKRLEVINGAAKNFYARKKN